MRKWLIAGWLLLPVLAGAYHFGPGQQRMQLDEVARHLAEARQCTDNGEWATAVTAYENALTMLPAEQTAESQRIRLELAKACMMNKRLPDANQSLKALLDELMAEDSADAEVLAESRSALANSQYYITWLMRLEGLPRVQWEPEIENARQTYRLLAEQAEAAGDPTEAKRHTEDLESAIRLARMDLKDLQGIPLPNQ